MWKSANSFLTVPIKCSVCSWTKNHLFISLFQLLLFKLQKQTGKKSKVSLQTSILSLKLLYGCVSKQTCVCVKRTLTLSSSSRASPVKYSTALGTILSRKKWPISKSVARVNSESSSYKTAIKRDTFHMKWTELKTKGRLCEEQFQHFTHHFSIWRSCKVKKTTTWGIKLTAERI